MTAVDKFPIPGVSQPGQAGDAAPGSLLSRLRHEAQEVREARTLTVPIPRDQGRVQLRARYGVLGLDELERLQSAMAPSVSNLTGSLEILSRAVQAIEALDPAGGPDDWLVLEDDLGPVTFDDRLARLLDWDRPDDDFTFSVRGVYERMFDGNGIAVGQHAATVAEFMGVVEQEAAAGKPSTAGRSTA